MIPGCDVLRFKQILKQKKYTQTKLAHEIGISVNMIHDRVSGHIHWRHTEALKACQVLGISTREFKSCYPYMWPLMGGD